MRQPRPSDPPLASLRRPCCEVDQLCGPIDFTWGPRRLPSEAPTGDLELQFRPGLQVIALLGRGVGELHPRQLHMESAHEPTGNFDHTRRLSRWGGCMAVVASTDDLLARWLFSD